MAEKKPRYWIANHHFVNITRRKLSTFEERNPRMFECGRSAHDTYEAARERVIAESLETLEKAVRDVQRAEKALKRALALKPPPEPEMIRKMDAGPP